MAMLRLDVHSLEVSQSGGTEQLGFSGSLVGGLDQ